MIFWYVFIAIIVIMIAGIMVQSGFKKTNLKYSAIANGNNKTGAQIATEILARNNITNVTVIQGKPNGDHYDPRKNVIALSPAVYSSSSIAAQAIAAHEAGHAIQWGEGMLLIKIRDLLIKPVGMVQQVSSTLMNIAFFFLLFGLLFNSSGLAGWVVIYLYCAASLYAAVGIFQIVTLPIEYNASHKAKAELEDMGYLNISQVKDGTSEVLSKAALTYVVAFLSSLTMLLFFILAILGRR